MKPLTNCENCPIRNSDIEEGSECNLGYNLYTGYFNKDGAKIPYSLEIWDRRSEYEYLYYSDNCQLRSIIHTETFEDGSEHNFEFTPDRTLYEPQPK